jgi:hypothetical protein
MVCQLSTRFADEECGSFVSIGSGESTSFLRKRVSVSGLAEVHYVDISEDETDDTFDRHLCRSEDEDSEDLEQQQFFETVNESFETRRASRCCTAHVSSPTSSSRIPQLGTSSLWMRRKGSK